MVTMSSLLMLFYLLNYIFLARVHILLSNYIPVASVCDGFAVIKWRCQSIFSREYFVIYSYM